MPFISSAQSVRSKLHLSELNTPALVGIGACAVALVLIVVLAIASLASANTSSYVTHAQSNDSSQLSADDSTGNDPEATSSSAHSVVVYMTGCVQKPGVYSVPAGSRIADVLELAGGFLPEARTESVNLARVVVDGEQITVPSIEDVTASTGQGAGAQDGSIAQAGTGKVNINSATAQELESLPGVGASTAQKILTSRTQDGPFATIDDIKRVSGIGDKKFEALKDLICV